MQKRMNNKISSTLLAVLIVASIASIVYTISGQPQKAYATNITISGRVVTSLNTSVANAKVYLEAPYQSGNGFLTPYEHAFTADAFGSFSISVPQGYSYTLDASKDGYSRARYGSTITTSTSGITLISNPQTTAILDLFVAPDDEFRSTYGANSEGTAWSKITAKEALYRDNWNVHFNKKYYSTAWTSPGSTDMLTLLNDAASDTGWSSGSYQGADELLAITGISGTLYCGSDPAAGCVPTPLPSTGGTHPKALVQDATSFADTSNHELFHNYGFSHHTSNYYCIMNTGLWKDFDTAQPSYDDTMAISGSVRSWY
jgi:hypothetical protein